ncbi:MAG TPA: hypothetical protein VGO09_00845 [Flavisolibacter sp.]|nr:hypothetical protein [Flavisolibacter sp.]
MNIFFDTLLKNPELNKIMSKEDSVFYKTVQDFIGDRLKCLNELIDREEEANQAKNILCHTEIIMETPPVLAFRNYSPLLRRKMADCFSEEDGEYFTLLIYQRLTRLLENK